MWVTNKDVHVHCTDGGEADIPAGTVMQEETLEHQTYPQWGAFKFQDTGCLIHDDDVDWQNGED